MIRLIVTREAKRDVADILDYLENAANAVVAEEVGREIRSTLLRLIQFPDLGSLRPALGPHVRMAISFPYALLYEHVPSQVELILLRVVHGRSNITAEILMRK